MANVNLAFKRALAGVRKDSASNNNNPRHSSNAKNPTSDDNEDRLDITTFTSYNRKTTTTTTSILGHRAAKVALPSFASSLIGDTDLAKDTIVLANGISAVNVHQLAVTLRPLPTGGAGAAGGSRPRMTASRWEVRKALLSLCSTQPIMFEIDVTDKSASIRTSFSVRAAAEELARKLSGVTVKIKGVKLHAFVREVSESAGLSEGHSWAALLLGGSGRGGGKNGKTDVQAPESESECEAAFSRLAPGRRPDTVVLRGIPANWLGEGGRAAQGTSAEGLERFMSRIGPVRAVEVAPSAPRVETPTSAAAASAALRGGSSSSLAAKGFDVHALLDKMPQPRALAKGNGKGEGGGVGRSVGGSSGGGARGGAAGAGAEAVSVGLNVDAWVQFESFRGFDMALKVFQGRVLQKTGAELLCEYRLGADVTGYMTEERRKEREEARAREAEEEERRALSIEMAKGQLVFLRDGLRGLEETITDDGRPALAEAAGPIMKTVTGHVEKAEALLGVFNVDEAAATPAVSHARGEIAIARLAIRKAREAVNRAEEEERKRLERAKDEELRDLAKTVLAELEDTLSRGLALIEGNRDHPGIKPQATKAGLLLQELSEACSRAGGSESLRGDDLVQEARKATDTATTRACMLQRYLSMCTRLRNLRATAAAMLAGDSGPKDSSAADCAREGVDNAAHQSAGARGNADHSTGETSTNVTARTTNADHYAGAVVSSIATGGTGANPSTGCSSCTILMEQLDLVGRVLGPELSGLSEGDILIISERAGVFLNAADAMVETVQLVNGTRARLAAVKQQLSGDPELKSSSASEGIMRLMAAAVMSTGKAQREGAATPAAGALARSACETTAPAPPATAAEPELEMEGQLLQAAERWTRSAQAADSDVRSAEEEVGRVAEGLRQRRQRDAQEKAMRIAEQERRAQEEQNIRAERQARALAREALQRKQAEARIAAMELRQKELSWQVRNKEARKRVREWFESQQIRAGRKLARDELGNDDDTDTPAITDRWTLDEGRDAISEAVPPTHPFTALNSSKTSRSDLDHEGRAGGGGGQVRAGSQERWALSDGAADLEERGIKTYGAGLYLPSSSSSSPPGLNSGLGAGMAVVGVASARAGKRRRQSRDVQDEADWLTVVSKALPSRIVGDIPQDISWTLPDDDEDEDEDGEGVEQQERNDATPTRERGQEVGKSSSTPCSNTSRDAGGGSSALRGGQHEPVSTETGAVGTTAQSTEAELREKLLAAMRQARSSKLSKRSGTEKR